MKIRSEFLDSVVFVCAEKNRQITPGGTGFLVVLRNEVNDDSLDTYVVTAAHSLRAIRGDRAYIRVNLREQAGYEDVATNKGDWFFHDHTDVAIIPFACDPARYAVQRLPILEMNITEDYRYAPGNTRPPVSEYLANNFENGIPVELGNEVFFVGLFAQSTGKTRNLPIVRFGRISRMPGSEPIPIEFEGFDLIRIRAYLAECHSWGGHSGSPAFWYYAFNPNEGARERVSISNRLYVTALLGLVSAHFDIERPIKRKGQQPEGIALLNSGIAVLTPSQDIQELLMREDVMDARVARGATL